MDGMLAELLARGLDEPYARQLVERYPQERLGQALTYFDGLPDAGPGLLVTAIREGRQPTSRKRDLMAEQRTYAVEIVAWLREHFPEFDRPVYGPHPAAVVAVTRLHWLYGKGRLTVREHGPEIRAAVARWEEEWE